MEPTETHYDLILKDFEALMDTTRQMSARMKLIQKEHSKNSRKNSRKTSDDPDSKKKTALSLTQYTISDELCMFLGFPLNSNVPRSEVTKAINTYIKENNLQDPANRKFILLEGSPAADKLKVLLRSPDQPVTFFSIQKYLKPHYPPSAKDKKNAEMPTEVVTVVPAEVPAEVVPEVAVPDAVVPAGVGPDTCEVEDVPKDMKTPKKKVTRKAF
jgi:chromatin remodeling complex protein RSC6